MNPETKTSKNQIKQLCDLHGIDYISSERVTVGFSNEVHLVNDNLVIKIYLPQDRRYEIELKALQLDLDIQKPKVIAYGLANNIIDHEYIFMTRISGAPLGHVWHMCSKSKRESLICDYINAQKEITKIAPKEFGFDTSRDWYQILRSDAEAQSGKLLGLKILSEYDLSQSLKLIDSFKDSLFTRQLYCVFWDVHLDNLMVDDNYNLKGVIDFEHIKLAALDYPLFVLRRLITDPKKFATKENEKYTKVGDYTEIWGWYQQHFPDMFNFHHIEERIKVYQLIDCLRLLEEWSHNQELLSAFHSLINKIG